MGNYNQTHINNSVGSVVYENREKGEIKIKIFITHSCPNPYSSFTTFLMPASSASDVSR